MQSIAGLYRYSKNFTIGGMNRTENERILPGGKGINVSIVLKNLGVSSTILGFIAGFTGEEIRKKIREAGCTEELISVGQGWSRINMKLRSCSESEINGQGPPIGSDAVAELLNRLETLEKGMCWFWQGVFRIQCRTRSIAI